MAIEFHCEHCGKLIRTSEENAGRRGTCPSCHQSVYIPTPDDQLEPLPVLPEDEEEERRERELIDEARKLARRLMAERDTPPETPAPSTPKAAPEGDARLARALMEEQIMEYIRSMARGDLTRAQSLAAEIRQDLKLANEVIARLTADAILPAELGDIPRPVVIGFLKQLREKK
jgi:hypothetical protein